MGDSGVKRLLAISGAGLELEGDKTGIGWVEDVDVHARCWPVLVHQLMAMALAQSGVRPRDAWSHLGRIPDFSGVTRAEFDRLLQHMLRDRSLVDVGGRMVLGPRAERRFGRRNFMDLYAVFSSPASYAVQTGGHPVGTLQQDFVDQLVEGASSFVLAGRAWFVSRVDHSQRRVEVRPAAVGRAPSWGGRTPMFLGFHLCQAMRDVLASDVDYPYLHATAQAALADRRAAFSAGLEEDDGVVRWWTWAGGRINATIRHALAAVGGDWKIVPDNFALRVEGASTADVGKSAARLRDPEFWEDDGLWAHVADELPGYRLSKFQDFMPAWAVREMLAGYLLDIDEAWHWATGAEPGQVRWPPVEDVEPASWTQPQLPIRWIDTADGLKQLVSELLGLSAVGLDVETTLRDRRLCLLQFGAPTFTGIVDALALSDLSPLAAVLGAEGVVKVVHNASFERSVLAKYGLELVAVFDTLQASRELRGRAAEGGHSLAVVCERELGMRMDKIEQTSDWSVRPLRSDQVQYAALDAEVMLGLRERLSGAQTG